MSSAAGESEVFSRARKAMRGARENDVAVLEAVAEIDVAATGYPSVERLLEDLFHIDRRDAKRWVRHAAALVAQVSLSGEPLPPRAPATAGVAARGEIGSGHVDVVLDALDRLAHLPAPVLAEAEQTLAEAATYLPPRALARVADRLIATLDPDGTAPGDDADPVDELHLGGRRGGPLNGKFRFHAAADRELIREVLDALSAPAGPDDPRSLATRQADAFVDLLAQAVSPTGIATGSTATDADDPHDGSPHDGSPHDGSPHDGSPHDGSPHDGPHDGTGADDTVGAPGASRERRGDVRPPVRALGRGTLTVTMDLDRLRAMTGHGTLDSESALSPAEARRLACDAGIVPMVLGARSEPLDVGRLSYTVPEGMRRTLVARDGGCAFPGCTRRPGRCAAHHVVHWAEGGRTALDNLALLCRYHHRLLHQNQWHIRMVDGRPWFVPPRWIDPRQNPRPGGRCPSG